MRRYDILDTPPDAGFDRITALAARLFDVPIAIISVVDTDRLWFKSHHGLPDVSETPRDRGLCASAVQQAGPWIVTDATTDSRTLANPVVAGSLGVRFYAGVPLNTMDGYNLGTLCVMGRDPRDVTPAEIVNLQDIAALVPLPASDARSAELVHPILNRLDQTPASKPTAVSVMRAEFRCTLAEDIQLTLWPVDRPSNALACRTLGRGPVRSQLGCATSDQAQMEGVHRNDDHSRKPARLHLR